MTLGVNSGGPRKSNSTDPTYWPKSNTNKPVDKPFSMEESQGVNRSVKTAPAENISETEKASQLNATKPVDLPKQATISRPMSQKDLVDLLISFQKSPTPENKQILSTLLQYGLEASHENFDSVSRLTQGKNLPNATESAVVSQLKGLASPRSVDVVSQYLAQTQNSIAALTTLQQTFQTLFQNLQQNGTFLPFCSGLCSIVSDMNDRAKKLLQKANEDPAGFLALKKGRFVQDSKSLSEFLGGVTQKFLAEDTPQFSKLKAVIGQAKEAVGDFIDSHITGAILSKESSVTMIGQDSFKLVVIPNPLSPAHNIELIIKKEPQKNKKITSPKTKFMIKCFTPDIGEVCASIELEDKKLWTLFFSDSTSTKHSIMTLIPEFKDKLQAMNYDVVSIQSIEKKIDIRKLLLPTLNLDSFSRVVTEV